MKKLFKKWFGITRIEELEKKVEELEKQSRGHYHNFSHTNERLANIEHRYKLAVDYHPAHPRGSWAVICINSKDPVLRFVDLNEKDARFVEGFIGKFDLRGRAVVDGPRFYRRGNHRGL